MTARIPTADPAERDRGLAAAATALRRGQLVGLPLDSAYGIAADAFSERGVAALREAKGRPDLSVPVMVPRIATVAGIAEVDADARALMLGFWPGALTLVLPVQPTLAWSLADGSGRIAVRMPLHPVALELLARTGPLAVAAAAPVAPEVTAITAGAAFPPDLADRLAVLLDAGPLPVAPASAVVDLTGPVPVLRRPGPLHPADLLGECPTLLVPTPDGPAPAP
ncbi:MAG TPA: L-threonylcarbamoyladenylate synthase [Candidatus Nanopelagicales bacterium]